MKLATAAAMEQGVLPASAKKQAVATVMEQAAATEMEQAAAEAPMK
jgi:hypothetical protein